MHHLIYKDSYNTAILLEVDSDQKMIQLDY